LNGQATDALQRTRKAVEVADGEGIEVDEFRTAVAHAETDLKAGRPGAVLQAIGQIDRLVSERRRTRQQEEQRRALEMARTAATKFISVKKLIEDLRKADIDITGAEEGLRAAERALEKRNFDDVDAILTTLDATAKELMDELIAAAKNLIGRAERKSKEGREKGIQTDEAVALLDSAEAHLERGEHEEMAAALSTGLESAANDLVTSVERVIEKNRSMGMDPGRADSVLQNARVAIKDHRFVEAIEYKKVIEDILEDARRKKDSRRIRDNLAELRAKLEAHAKLGADVRMASELLARAEALVDAGEYADVDGYAKRISDEIDAARRKHLASVVDTFASLIEDGLSLGLSPEELDEYRMHAQEAAAADDIEEVYR